MNRNHTSQHASRPKRIVVGISGASGAPYAKRLIQCLCDANVETHVISTPHGRQLFRDEMGITELTDLTLVGRACSNLVMHKYRDVGAVLGSGSFATDGMIVCPASGNTLASLAAGLADNLLDRAVAVHFKESRRLVIVPREMPMSRIELQNCLRLQEAGAIICPACPGFYMLPKTIDDLVDFVVGKLLDLVDVPHTLNTRWETMAPLQSAELQEE